MPRRNRTVYDVIRDFIERQPRTPIYNIDRELDGSVGYGGGGVDFSSFSVGDVQILSQHRGTCVTVDGYDCEIDDDELFITTDLIEQE